MVTAKLIGGLGNQMFQYALGRRLSYQLGSRLELDISGFHQYKLHKFGLTCFALNQSANIIDSPIRARIQYRINRFLPLKYHFGDKKVIEKDFSFDMDVLKLKGNIILDGYWQSERYFKDIREVLLNDFKIIFPQDSTNQESSNKIQNCEAVSLHIRRGDYVNDVTTLEKHGICDLDYYHRAISYLKDRILNPSFFIFSDDPEWAKQNLKIDYPITFITNNDASKNYEDLRLMSLCRHNIIANSSFSWWGAWLNENPSKIVIAPKKWFNDKSVDTTDLIPDTWISL